MIILAVMPRPRSPHTDEVKTRLIDRLQNGYQRPGGQFFSNREIAGRFGVSYQTAHRLVGELVAEGWLERRAGSGTFLAGRSATVATVELIFDPRARRPDSFGARLLRELGGALDAAGIARQTRWGGAVGRALAPTRFPVCWETPAALAELAGRYALLLNDHPPAGLAASYVDSVAADDFSGGVCAAELLSQWAGARGRYAVLAGPRGDRRAAERAEGFRAPLPKATVHWSASWFYEDGRRAATTLMAARPTAVFCGNDRLAEGLIDHCREAGGRGPFLVGFDDAPVAERLNFSTVAIPWREMADAAVGVIKKRRRGDTGTAARQLFAPRPVVRQLRAI